MDWSTVAAAVAERMRARGLNRTSLATRAGVDRSTVGRLLDGDAEGMRPDTIGRIEHALGWPPGHIDRIGADPDGNGDDVESSAVIQAIDNAMSELAELRERIGRIIRRSDSADLGRPA